MWTHDKSAIPWTDPWFAGDPVVPARRSDIALSKALPPIVADARARRAVIKAARVGGLLVPEADGSARRRNSNIALREPTIPPSPTGRLLTQMISICTFVSLVVI